MNHIKEALKDKNGDAYIWLCVIVVFISMLLSVLILYMGLLSQVQIQKRDVKTKLDSVVSEYKATLCAGTVVTRGTLGQEPIFESTNFFTGPATGETC